MTKRAVLLAVLYLAAGTALAAKPDYDTRKRSVLAERREVRRATERAHEDCLRRGGAVEKCLAVGYEAGRKRLADWRRTGQNPHAFTHY